MSLTLMEHPDHGIRKVPLNEWAKYRRSGWTFCNEKAKSIADAEAEVAETGADLSEDAAAEEPAKADPPATGKRRTTKAKEE